MAMRRTECRPLRSRLRAGLIVFSFEELRSLDSNRILRLTAACPHRALASSRRSSLLQRHAPWTTCGHVSAVKLARLSRMIRQRRSCCQCRLRWSSLTSTNASSGRELKPSAAALMATECVACLLNSWTTTRRSSHAAQGANVAKDEGRSRRADPTSMASHARIGGRGSTW